MTYKINKDVKTIMAITAMLAPMLVLPAFAETDVTTIGNDVLINKNLEKNTVKFTWNIEDFPENTNCISKTELKTYNGTNDNVGIKMSFVGKNKLVLQEGPILFRDIVNNTDAIISCSDVMKIKFAAYDWINLNDYSAFTTFAAVISPEFVDDYADSPFLAFNTTNIVNLNEAQYANSLGSGVVYDRKSCQNNGGLPEFNYKIIDQMGIQKGEVTYDTCQSLP